MPEAVYELNDVHYFYWPWEIGLGFINIGKFRIPEFPIKLWDYEPAKLLRIGEKLAIVSRYHYRILTYFNNPDDRKSKPVLDFYWLGHSPIVRSKFPASVGLETKPFSPDSREIDAMLALSCLFMKIFAETAKTEESEGQDYSLVSGKVPEEALFDFKKMVAVVWVGKRPTSDEFKVIGFDIPTDD